MAKKYNKWTEYQDNVLVELVQKQGDKNWTLLAKLMRPHLKISKRSAKQIRERWINQLKVQIKNEKWSAQEDLELIRLEALLGTKWIEIAKHFDGRTDNNVKNRFYSIIRKSLRMMCKFASVKAKMMKVYEIKPYTLSKIFMIGEGNAQIWQPQSGHEVQSISGIFSRGYYHEITQIIKTFIFGFDKYSKSIEMPSKEKVVSVLQRISFINSQFQTQHFLEQSTQNIQSSNIIFQESQQNQMMIRLGQHSTSMYELKQENDKPIIQNSNSRSDPLIKAHKLNSIQQCIYNLNFNGQRVYNKIFNEQDNFIDSFLSMTSKFVRKQSLQ